MTNVVNLSDFRKQPEVTATDVARNAMVDVVEALRPYVDLTSNEVAADLKVLTWLTKGLIDRQFGKQTLAVELLDTAQADANAILNEVNNVVVPS